MWGLRAQGGVTYRSFALAVRYAYLVPDSQFAYMSVPLTGSEAIQELTPSATWFIKGQRLKLLADLPVIIHDPVFTETNVGSYAATDLPDQATVLATAGVPTGNTVARQTVFEARLALQAQF